MSNRKHQMGRDRKTQQKERTKELHEQQKAYREFVRMRSQAINGLKRKPK